MTPSSLETTRKKTKKGGEREEKKKGLLALIIFILATLEIVSERQKSVRDTPAESLRPSGTVFKNPGRYIYIDITLHDWVHVEGLHYPSSSHCVAKIHFHSLSSILTYLGTYYFCYMLKATEMLKIL